MPHPVLGAGVVALNRLDQMSAYEKPAIQWGDGRQPINTNISIMPEDIKKSQAGKVPGGGACGTLLR